MVLQLCFVLHMLACSFVNLGDPYPWYTDAPLAHSVILATFVVHVVSSAVLVRAPRPRLAWDPAAQPPRAWPVSLSVIAAMGWQSWPLLAGRFREPLAPHLVESNATFDLARQSAGVWLREHTSGTEILSTYEGLPAFEYEGRTYDFSGLNSAPDERRWTSAAYELGVERLAEGASFRTSEPGTDRELVATFRYDGDDDFHVLYAKRESELYRSGVRHLVFPTPVPSSESPIEQHGNRWLLPGTGFVRFGVESPGPPVLLLALRIVRAGNQSVREGDAVRWTIVSGGLELASGELHAGDAPVRVQATAHAPEAGPGPAGGYAFEIGSRDTGSQEGGAIFLEAMEILLRYGEPLRAADFELATPRCRSRIDHLENRGMPSGFFGW